MFKSLPFSFLSIAHGREGCGAFGRVYFYTEKKVHAGGRRRGGGYDLAILQLLRSIKALRKATFLQ